MLMTIKKFAENCSVTTETIRNWEKEGKIVSTRTQGGHRRFDIGELEKINKKNYTLKEFLSPTVEKIMKDSTEKELKYSEICLKYPLLIEEFDDLMKNITIVKDFKEYPNKIFYFYKNYCMMYYDNLYCILSISPIFEHLYNSIDSSIKNDEMKLFLTKTIKEHLNINIYEMSIMADETDIKIEDTIEPKYNTPSYLLTKFRESAEKYFNDKYNYEKINKI